MSFAELCTIMPNDILSQNMFSYTDMYFGLTFGMWCRREETGTGQFLHPILVLTENITTFSEIHTSDH